MLWQSDTKIIYSTNNSHIYFIMFTTVVVAVNSWLWLCCGRGGGRGGCGCGRVVVVVKIETPCLSISLPNSKRVLTHLADIRSYNIPRGLH